MKERSGGMARGLPILGKRAVTQRRVVAISSENMLILRLSLPPVSASQRKAAAFFAAEPFLGQPLEDVQVILCPHVDTGASGGYLAVVMSRKALDQVLQQNLDSAARLVPDVLLLPRPVGEQWTVAERGGRLLARLPDGTGFSALNATFRAIWTQSGKPPITWVSGIAPADLPLASQSASPFPLVPEPALAQFDLAGGRTPDWRQPRRLMALAAILVLGICAHLGLLALDTSRITAVADTAEQRLRQELTGHGIAIGTSVEAAAADALRGMKVGKKPDFLPLLSDALQAMAGQSGTVTLQDMSFDNHSGQLILTLVAPDLGPLQDTAALLTKAGMQAVLGTSTISEGHARASLAIKGGVAG
ncbi:MAG: type II secretion system protein GspL [Paracoccaceae bacterium]